MCNNYKICDEHQVFNELIAIICFSKIKMVVLLSYQHVSNWPW